MEAATTGALLSWEQHMLLNALLIALSTLLARHKLCESRTATTAPNRVPLDLEPTREVSPA